MIISVHQYFDRAVNILLDKRDENAAVDIRGPQRIPRRDDFIAINFRARVVFESGHILDIADHFLIEPLSDEWARKFSYFFGLPGGEEAERLFLFDNHGEYGGAAHLDLGDGERIYEGDQRLHGISPENVDIMDVCGFVDRYFDGSPFPWGGP